MKSTAEAEEKCQENRRALTNVSILEKTLHHDDKTQTHMQQFYLCIHEALSHGKRQNAPDENPLIDIEQIMEQFDVSEEEVYEAAIQKAEQGVSVKGWEMGVSFSENIKL